MFVSVLSKVAARFVRDQRGATMLEYGLLVGLVAIAAIIAVTAMGGALSSMFTDAANACKQRSSNSSEHTSSDFQARNLQHRCREQMRSDRLRSRSLFYWSFVKQRRSVPG